MAGLSVIAEEERLLSKVTTLKDAISMHVKSGNTVFIAGPQHGEATAALHEIVRQKIDHLTLVGCLLQTQNLMIGEGLLDKLVTGWTMQGKGGGYAEVKAKAAGKFPKILEYSHFGLSTALMASQVGVPFLPTRCMVGSDILKYNGDVTEITCPFTGINMAAVKAITPDVGIIHTQISDADGNAHKWGTLGMDIEGINASKTVIVTTEKIVESDVIRRNPNATIIPGFRVAAVIEVPFGSHPLHLAGCYKGDMFGYLGETGPKEGYENYVNNFIYGVRDWAEYIEARRKVKGEQYFEEMKIKNPLKSEPIISGY